MICRSRYPRVAQIKMRRDMRPGGPWLCGRNRVSHPPYSSELDDVLQLAGRRVTLRPLRAEDGAGMTIS